MWARHASPLRIGGLENPPSVKFQLKIQSVVIREIRGSFSITITIFGHTQWATHASPLLLLPSSFNSLFTLHSSLFTLHSFLLAPAAPLSVVIYLKDVTLARISHKIKL